MKSDKEITQKIWARHDSLMSALPPTTRDEFLASARNYPDTAEKDRFWLMCYVEDLEQEIEELLSDLERDDW